MDDKTIDRIFAGNFEGLPELCNTVVKIYICSTYTDMTLEKNTLQSEVYPKLREYCRERHGLEFQIVDMRWGIRDDATDDHMTTHICLEEIRNCQKTSLGPNFIFLGGQKYGYRPVPTFIPHDEFNLILNMLKEFEKNTEILTDWYEKDTNSIPVMMILQPISSHYPNFLNSQVPKLQSEDQEKWWRTLCKLQETLREAAYNLFKRTLKLIAWLFFRTIMNINTSDKTITGKPAHYLDMENRQINKAASLLLTSLKDDKLVKKLEKGNSFRYEVEWVGVTEIKALSVLIDKAMKKVDNSTRGVLAHEIGKHMNLCVDGSPFFYGQEDNLEKVKDYVKGESRGCLLVYGRSGTGKSFLMGKIAMSVHLWLAPLIPMMVIRFIGSTSASSSIELVLFSICKQICYNLEISLEEVPEEFVPLKNFFKSLLEKASETNFVGICEEESNHLLLGELGYDLAISILKKWMCTMSNRRLTHFQWRTAMNAVAVCSTPLFLRLCYSQMKSWRSYTIPEETKLPFSVDAFVTLLFDQIEFKCGKQLVSRTVSYITASRHGLTESEIVDILSLDDIVLHEIFTYTKPQVRRLPPILWTKIKRELEGYITEIETDGTKVIVWAHSQFIFKHVRVFPWAMEQWVEKSFKYSQVQAQRMGLSDREDKADRKVPSQPNVFISPNGKVSRYNFRKFSELPYHLVKSNRFSDLAEHALFNYDWLHSKISGSLMKHVLDDFIHALSAISDKKLYRQVKKLFNQLE
ncbi:unnamed protein product [Lepeophtheirus salmonis]|uniref:(salmon louse) hypothetical protein n=1 Tax=Lepeophtheirus salmonis TaxID=72036 RepID=A0A7R8CRE7_LEPSM|nr:unnamed protein product [Lepeophtheirus salmonis]CAF2904515.1 unnamed protein product [Lepeophtheirus salmonis]